MIDSLEIKDQLVKNSLWGMVSSILNRIGGFVLIILISRMLMPEGFGKYSLVMTIALFFITFSDLGINQTLIRYVSLEIERDNSKAVAYFKYLLKIRLLLTLGVSLILLLGAYVLSYYIFKDSTLFFPLIILSIYVFFISLTGFFESLFFIKKNVGYISIKEFFSIIFKVLSILLIWLFIIQELKLIWLFISLSCFSILTFLFVFYFSKKRYPPLFKTKEISFDKKDISRFMILLNIQNISLLVLSSITIILLGIFLSSEFVGYYNSSWTLVSGIISLLFSFSSVFLPVFTAVKEETFQILLKRIFRISLLLALPISFGLSLFSKFFIVAIYGEAYFPAIASLSIISFIIPLIVGTNLAIDSFSARNKQKRFVKTISLFAVVFFLLNLIFIKLLSEISGELTLIGVSIINLVMWFFCFISAIYFLKKELNLYVLSIDIFKSIISCLVMSAFILGSLRLLGSFTLLSGIITILFSIIIYFSCLFLIKGITQEDIILIKQILKKR